MDLCMWENVRRTACVSLLPKLSRPPVLHRPLLDSAVLFLFCGLLSFQILTWSFIMPVWHLPQWIWACRCLSPTDKKDVPLVVLIGLLSPVLGLTSAETPVPAQWKQRGGFDCALKHMEINTALCTWILFKP